MQSRSTHAPGGDEFAAVSAVSPDDVWAVGDYLELSDPPARRTLAQHWNGRTWSVVASPNVGTGHNKLYVRRNARGTSFKEVEDVGRSLAQDRRRKARTVAKRGQGDKGDRRRSAR